MNGYEWQLINLFFGGSFVCLFHFFLSPPLFFNSFFFLAVLSQNNREISATQVSCKYHARHVILRGKKTRVREKSYRESKVLKTQSIVLSSRFIVGSVALTLDFMRKV